MSTHVDEFAERLRFLKERSGRSYGTLAARLHVSTSTLHRYCNGAAVPAEYAPVERFARQCGAGAEELVALHQLWLLAEAARRLGPNRGAGLTGSPEGEPAAGSPEGAPVPGAPGATGSDSPEGASGAGAPEGAPASAEGDPTATSPVSTGTTRTAGTAAAAEGDPTAALPPPVDVPPTPPRQAPHRFRHGRPVLRLGRGRALLRFRRGRAFLRFQRRTGLVVLAAAAVLAVGLPLGLAALHGGQRPRALSVPPLPGAGSTARPSPSGGSPDRTAVAGASASASTPPDTAGTAGRTPVAPPVPDSGKPPLQVTVLADNWDTQCDQWYLLQQPPGRVPPLPPPQQTDAWAAALGGVPAQDLRLQLTVQSRPGEPVVLHTLYVTVVGSATAPAGNGYTLSAGCGGGLAPASFAVDLDATAPRARSVSGFNGGDREPAVDFPLQVSATDAEVLDVDAHTLDHDVSWYLDLVWSSGTRQGTLRIDDHGHPFRTVGLKGDPLYYYTSTAWIPIPKAPQGTPQPSAAGSDGSG